MPDEVENHILKRFDLKKRLGKGVRKSSKPKTITILVILIEYKFQSLKAYGIVWKAVDKKTNEVVALKKIFDAFRNETDAQVKLLFEYKTIKNLNILSVFLS